MLVQIEANCQLARYVADIFDTQLSVRRLGRNNLEGIEGDSENVLLNCAGHNLRLILKRLKSSCARIFAQYMSGKSALIVHCRGRLLLCGAECGIRPFQLPNS
ncbi:MAG: hypothetical protein F4082_03415 [Gammaproteobacteria bacterium]|nr:hypothetical protein [Gammaproteobacteria bacterium]